MVELRKALLGVAWAGALVVAVAVSALPSRAAPVDAAVANFLGDDMLDILASADRVESFQLEAKTDVTDPSVQGYAVRASGPALTVGQVERFRSLIFAESSYLFDKSKRCPFLADTGFVFHAGERQASIVLSQSCMLWSFARAAERGKIEDYDPIESDIKTLLAELFEKP